MLAIDPVEVLLRVGLPRQHQHREGRASLHPAAEPGPAPMLTTGAAILRFLARHREKPAGDR